MYSEDDLNAAVAAGALSPEDAARLRAHVEERRELPRLDEENFRLVTSFNDIFVSIGVVIMLVAVTSIANAFVTDAMDAALPTIRWLVIGVATAATAWGLAEIFTRRRRMALPSIILTWSYIFSVLTAAAGLVLLPFGLAAATIERSGSLQAQLRLSDWAAAGLVIILAALIIAITIVATRFHWKRFMVPITIAVGVGAAVGAALLGIGAAFDALDGSDNAFPWLPIVLVCGLGVFALAMRWDMSDRQRLTRRSDVAFWLHLLAAPMIAHPLFAMLGVTTGEDAGVVAAIGVVAIYIAFGLVALTIDRRALLVSALAYVLIAMGFLLRTFGAVDFSFALTAFVIGSALLALSTFWSTLRARIVTIMPENLQVRVPPIAALHGADRRAA